MFVIRYVNERWKVSALFTQPLVKHSTVKSIYVKRIFFILKHFLRTRRVTRSYWCFCRHPMIPKMFSNHNIRSDVWVEQEEKEPRNSCGNIFVRKHVLLNFNRSDYGHWNETKRQDLHSLKGYSSFIKQATRNQSRIFMNASRLSDHSNLNINNAQL